jgi:type IV secretion system protein VirB5
MTRALLGSIALGSLLVLAPAARAQGMPVIDTLGNMYHALEQSELVQQTANAVRQLEELQRQYQMMTYQYQAIAHVPQQVMSMGSALTSPTLQNPLPEVSQFSGILSGNSLGPVTGLANTVVSTDRYYEPTGSDAGATEMIRRRSSTSGIEAMAMNGIASLQAQTKSLGEFLSSIGSSPDVQQSAAINARLALEQNYAARQQASATHLQTLAMMQQAVSQQRDTEASRQDAEQWRDATAAAFQ